MNARRRQLGLTLMELLVVVAIGSVITGMVLMVWFGLNRSSAMTTSSSQARDFARDGIARLGREIRDAEPLPGHEAIQQADAWSITFTTSFNEVGNDLATTAPRLVRYWYDENTDSLRRTVDSDGDQTVTLADGVTPDPGDRTSVIVPHLLNIEGARSEAVFTYTYMDGNANRKTDTTPVPLSGIVLVRIHLLVDLDPGKAPRAMDLTTEVQLRNQRVF